MSGTEPSGGRHHIPALDGLRGVAVAGVVLYHLGYLSGGFLGVDLFFVLSGYLITTVIVTEWVKTGAISLPAFWARRARRLLPAAFIVLAAVAVYAANAATAIDRGPIRADGLAALFYVANWHQISAGVNYFDIFRTRSPLEHMWSLSVEEQFYLLWPLIVVAALGRRAKRSSSTDAGLNRLLVITVGGALASIAAMLLLFRHGHSVDRVYYGTDTRAGAILMGAALAVGRERWGRAIGVGTAQVLDLVAILSIGVITVVWATADGSSAWLYEGGLTATGLAVCVLLAALVTPNPGLPARILSIRPLRYLGRISYGVYLWHWPVIVALTAERAHLHGVPLSVLRVAITLVFAALSAELIENPIRRGSLNGRIALSSACAGAAVCALLLVVSTTAATNPLSGEMAAVRANPGQLVIATDPVTTSPAATTLPPVTTPGPAAVTLVVGDSGAYFLGAGMARVAAEFNRTVINRGTIGCGLARADGRLRLHDGRIVTDAAGCDQYLQRWQGYLNQYRPSRVVLVLADVGGGERFVQGRWIRDCDPQFDAFFQFEIARGIHVLQSTGADVTITTIPDIVGDDNADDARRVDCRNASLEAGAASQRAQVVDLRHWSCPTPASCIGSFQGADIRPDRVHFVGVGADLASRWILDQVKD